MLIAVLALPAPAAMCIFAAKARDGLRLYGRRRPLRAGGFGSYNLKTHILVARDQGTAGGAQQNRASKGLERPHNKRPERASGRPIY